MYFPNVWKKWEDGHSEEAVTDMCDGKILQKMNGAYIKTRRCSVWSHTGGLEEVDRNHPMTHPNHCGAEEARRAHNPKDGWSKQPNDITLERAPLLCSPVAVSYTHLTLPTKRIV